MKIEININETVEVVLTAYGAAVYNEYYWEFDIPEKLTPRMKQTGDVLRDQLWSIMKIFGPAIGLGKQSPFVECLMIIGKNVS